jgi:hypothetical protein
VAPADITRAVRLARRVGGAAALVTTALAAAMPATGSRGFRTSRS